MAKKLHEIRNEYTSRQLDESGVPYNPFSLLETWVEEAISAKVPEPTAMNLATAGMDGKPSSRMVLLKEISQNSLSFFTNYNSRKGNQISENPWAALLFFWPELERQIRLEGNLRKMSDSQSEQYFNTRPPESRIAAIVSKQSQSLESRNILEEKFRQFTKDHKNSEIQKPPYWGGYYFMPVMIEFWQGRPNRLHDRIVYHLGKNNWTISRLYP